MRHLTMNKKLLTYSVLSILLLGSCKQLKSLGSHDNSSASRPVKQTKNRGVTFLDDISVTPGQVVTSKHSTIGPVAPKVKKGRTVPEKENTFPAGDIERADWLQLKYAIMLDASVEKLSNVKMLKLIDEWWGVRYCMGGSTKDCIDCSAFTQIIISNVYGINMPRTSREQYSAGDKIGMEELEEGDLVFFSSGGEISHVGIYMLNNKFVHASTSGGVMFNDLNDIYWREKFKGAARVTNRTAGTR